MVGSCKIQNALVSWRGHLPSLMLLHCALFQQSVFGADYSFSRNLSIGKCKDLDLSETFCSALSSRFPKPKVGSAWVEGCSSSQQLQDHHRNEAVIHPLLPRTKSCFKAINNLSYSCQDHAWSTWWFFQKINQTGSWGKVYSAPQDSRWSSYSKSWRDH